PAGATYTVPLQGLPRLEHLDVSVHAGQGGARAALEESDYVPTGDFAVDRSKLSGGDGLRSGELAVVRVRPEVAAGADALGSTMILIDTSASRALGLDEEIGLARALVKRILETAGPATPVTIACFDQTIEMVFQGAASEYDATHEAKIRARG